MVAVSDGVPVEVAFGCVVVVAPVVVVVVVLVGVVAVPDVVLVPVLVVLVVVVAVCRVVVVVVGVGVGGRLADAGGAAVVGSASGTASSLARPPEPTLKAAPAMAPRPSSSK